MTQGREQNPAMLGGGIVGANPLNSHKRKAYDFYPTPPEVTQALIDRFPEIGRSLVWEPACGDGDMVNVLRANGAQVSASDIRNTGFGVVRNFLEDLNPADIPRCDWIITNPPFEPADKFIRQCKTLQKARIGRGEGASGLSFAMLLKSTYWHAKGRYGLFEETKPSFVLPLTWRPSFLEAERGKSPLMEVSWFVWLARPKSLYTRFEPLLRPDGRAQGNLLEAAA